MVTTDNFYKTPILNIKTYPYKVNGFEEYDLGSEMLLYYPEKEVGVSLNSSSKAIWNLCNGKLTPLKIAEELSQRFDFYENELLLNELLLDVIAAIKQLHDLGVLELGEAPYVKSA